MRLPALLLLIGVVSACSQAAPPGGDALPDTLERISRAFFDEHRLPGLAVGVIAEGRPVYTAGFGTTRLDDGTPVSPRTIFHLASVTKPFVATAIMQLVEQGKVDLDAPVRRYVSYFRMKDARAQDITVRQVLTHSAGLPDVTDYGWDSPEYDDGALERYIRGLADSTLIAAPGARWAYSNIGFELLADLIAKVSGQPFESYVQQRILTPLGMGKSTLLMVDVDSTLLAWGHEPDSTGVHHPVRGYPYNRRHAASSTLHSNVDDMLRWALANLDRGRLGDSTILSPDSYRRLWRPERDITEGLVSRARQAGIEVPFDRLAIGLSWFLPIRNGHRLVNHSGGDRGFRTDLLLAPDTRAAVVVLANGNANMWELSVALMDAVLAGSPSGR